MYNLGHFGLRQLYDAGLSYLTYIAPFKMSLLLLFIDLDFPKEDLAQAEMSGKSWRITEVIVAGDSITDALFDLLKESLELVCNYKFRDYNPISVCQIISAYLLLMQLISLIALVLFMRLFFLFALTVILIY